MAQHTLAYLHVAGRPGTQTALPLPALFHAQPHSHGPGNRDRRRMAYSTRVSSLSSLTMGRDVFEG